MNDTAQDQILTIQQAADFLKVSTKTLRRWETKGILVPERTIGNQRRYTLRELQDFKKLGRNNLALQTQTAEDETQDSQLTPEPVVPTTEPVTSETETIQTINLSEPTPSKAQDTPQLPSTPLRTTYTPGQPSGMLPAPIILAEKKEEEKKEAVADNYSLFKKIPSSLNGQVYRNKYGKVALFGGAGITAIGLLVFGITNIPFALSPTNGRVGDEAASAQQGQNQSSNFTPLKSSGKGMQGEVTFNVPVVFNEDIKINNKDLDLGTGRLTASNVVYGLTAGSNITITGNPQNPVISADLSGITNGVSSIQGQTGALTLTTGSGISLDGLQISNTGVLSLQGQTGAVELTAGSGVGVDGTTISNTDPGSSQNIFKTIVVNGSSILAGSNSDTLTFVEGAGISITPDTSNKTITITSNASGTLSGLATNGVLYATSATNATTTSPGTTGTVLKGVTGSAPVFGAVSLSADVTGTLGIGNGGTGVTGTPSNGQVLIGNGSGYTLGTLSAGSGIGISNGVGTISVTNNGVLSLAGTANQVSVSGATGNVTLSLPQNIHTTATPTFASLSLTANTNQLTLGTGNTGIITMASLTTGRTYTLPDASGEVCLSTGNCPGGGGGNIDGSGTTNYLAKFTDTADIGNSLLYDTGQKIGLGTTSPQGLFSVSGDPGGTALVNLNYTGSGQNILVGSASGTTRFAFDASGNLNLVSGNYQIGGANVLSSTALGSGVVSSSLTSVGALNAGSITSGFGSIDTGSDDISGGNITATGATGFTASGNEADLTFSGTGNHDITASAGTLRIGASTLIGAITGNSQNVTGLGNLSAGGTVTFGGLSTNNGLLYTNGSGQLTQAAAGTSGQILVANGSGVPTFVTLGTDATVDATGALTIANNAVALGTDTTGNYVSNVSGGSGISITGSAGEGWTPSVALGALTADWDQTGGFDIVLNHASSELRILESSGAFYGAFDIGDLSNNRTYTFPDNTGTVCIVEAGNCAGSGTGVTTAGGTTDRLVKFTGAQAVGNASITDLYTNGVAMTIGTSGSIGVGTTSPLAGIDVRGNSGTTPAASFSGTTSTAGLIVDNNGTGDLLTASKSGSVKFVVTNNGNLQFAGNTGFLNTLTSLATQNRTYTLPDASGTICLTSGNCAGAGGGVTGSGTAGQIAYFDGSGTITSETSGFAWDGTNNKLGIGNDSPVGKFDLNGAVTGKALAILNETGDQNILTGSASGTTRFNFDRSGNLNLIGGGYQIGGTNVLTSTALGTNVVSSFLTSVGALTGGSIASGFGTIATANSISGSSLGISGTTVVDASRNLTNIAGISSSLTPTAANTYALGTGTGNQYSTIYGQTIFQNGNQVCDLSGNCSGLNVNYWEQNNGALSAKNTTVDFLIGGTASNAAKFAVLNVNPGSGTTTASVAGSTGASYLTAAGNLQTTNFQTLTLGGTSTGGIVLDSGNAGISVLDAMSLSGSFTQSGNNAFTTGTGQVTLNGNVDATSGLDVSGADFTVGGSNATISIAGAITGTQLDIDNLQLNGNTLSATSGDMTIDAAGDDIVSSDRLTIGTTTPGLGQFNVSGSQAGKALAILNETGANAIFTASASGVTRFTIANNGQITANAYGSGIAHFSPTGLISSSAVDLASADITGTLGAGNGGTGFNSYATGDLLVGNGSSTLSKLTVGGEGSVLTVQSGSPTWVSSSSLNFWQRANGALAPLNLTDDLLLGGSSTASAKFAFINNTGSGTPTASISAGTTGATYLTAAGTLQTTNNQTLNIGGNTTGDIIFNGDGAGFIGIRKNNPVAELDIYGSSYLQAAQAGDGFRFSSPDLNRHFDITWDGSNIWMGMTNQTMFFSATGYHFANGSINLAGQTMYGTDIHGNMTLDSNSTGTKGNIILNPSGGNVGIGITNPIASFDLRGSSPAFPLASISGQTTSAGLIVNNNGTGNLFTASSSGLERFTVRQNGTVGIGTAGTTMPSAGALEIYSPTDTTASLLIKQRPTQSADLLRVLYSNDVEAFRVDTFGHMTVAGDANVGRALGVGEDAAPTFANINVVTLGTDKLGMYIRGQNGQTANLLQVDPVFGTSGAWFDESANLRIGASALDIGKLNVSGAYTGKALAILDETGGNDIFTASASGTTRLTLSNGGNLNLIGGVYQSGGVSGITQGSPSCVTTTGGIVTGTGVCQLGSEQWIVNNGAIYTGIQSLDLLLGGTATSSAKFAFINNSGTGTPTASISANSGANNTFLTGNGVLGTTNAQTLQLGTAGTGNVSLTPGGITALTAFTNGRIGIGTSNPLGTLDVRAQSGTLPIASFSGQTSSASVIVNNNGTGDIFTASASGLSRFVIHNNGNVAIGRNLNSSYMLDMVGNSASAVTAEIPAIRIANTNNSGNSFATFDLVTANGAQTGRLTMQGAASNANLFLYTEDSAPLRFGTLNTERARFTANGNYGFNATLPMASLDLRGLDAGLPIASISGATSGTGLMVDNRGSGDLFTASTSSQTKFTILNNGNIRMNNYNTAGGVFYGQADGTLGLSAAGSPGQCLQSNGTSAPSWTSCAASNYWQLQNGALSPFSTTADLLIGGTSTSAAKFAMVNNAGGDPTLKINTVGQGIAKLQFLEAGTDGVDMTYNGVSNALILSGTSEGTPIAYFGRDGSVAIGTDTPSGALFDVAGSASISGALTLGDTSFITTTKKQTLTLGSNDTGNVVLNSGGTHVLTATSNGNVGIGTANPEEPLHLYSSTDSTGLRIESDNAGGTAGINLDRGDSSGFSFIDYQTDGTAHMAIGLRANSNNFFFWDPQSSDAIRLMIESGTGNIGIGNNISSPLARLDVRGESGTLPVASVSGNTARPALMVDNNGTGDLFTASKSGATQFVINNAGNVGIGPSARIPTERLHLDGKLRFVNATEGSADGNVKIFTGTGPDASAVGELSGAALTNVINYGNSGNGLIFQYGGSTDGGGMKLTDDGLVLWGAGDEDHFRVVDEDEDDVEFVIDAQGYVGLGVTDARTKLHVFDETAENVASFSGINDTTIYIGDNTPGRTGEQYITYQNADTGNEGWMVGMDDDESFRWDFGSVGEIDGYVMELTQSANLSLYHPTDAVGLHLESDDEEAGIALDRGDVSKYGYVDFNTDGVGYWGMGQASGTNDFSIWDRIGNLDYDALRIQSGTRRIAIGGYTSNPLSTLDVRGVSGTVSVASFSGQTSDAGLLVDNNGTGALFTASKSGATKFVITNAGNVGIGTANAISPLTVAGTSDVLGNFQTSHTTASIRLDPTGNNNFWDINATNGNNFILEYNDSNVLSLASTGDLTLHGTNYNSCGMLTTVSNVLTCSSAPASTTNHWNIANGLLYNGNQTTDIVLGGISSSSAKLKVSPTGVTASVSGLTSTAAMVVDNRGNGDLFTASTAGTTRFVINNNGNVGIGTAIPTDLLTVQRNLDMATRVVARNSNAGNSAKAEFVAYNDSNFALSSGILSSTTPTFGANTANSAYIYTDSSSGLVLMANNATGVIKFAAGSGSGPNEQMRLDSSGNLAIGTQTALGTLDVRANSFLTPVASFSGSTGRATMIVDQTNIGDIFTASKSGATKFVINNQGNVGIGVTSPTELLHLDGKIRLVNASENTNNGNVKIFTGTGPDAAARGNLGGAGLTAITDHGDTGNGLIFQYGGSNDAGGMKLSDDGLVLWGAGDEDLFKIIDEDSNAQVFEVDNAGNLTVGVGSDTGATNPRYISSNEWSSHASFANGIANYIGNWAGSNIWGIGGGTNISGDNTLRLGSISSGNTFDTNQRLRLILGGTAGASALGTIDLRSVSATIPTATISAQSNFAAAVVDQSGNGDIFTASKSGETRFTVKGNGTVVIGNLPANVTPRGSLHLWGDRTNGANTAIQFGDAGFGNPYIRESGTNDSDSLEIGGRLGLSFRTNSDGAVGGYGIERMTIDQYGKVGIGVPSTALATLDVRGNTAHQPIASLSGNTSFAGLIVDNTGAGNLFTASKSGATKFVIRNNGDVGIGTALPESTLDVVGLGSSTDPGALARFGSAGSPTAGNFHGIQIDKNTTETLFIGINKNSATGAIPSNGTYISTYQNNGTISIGRGDGVGSLSTADLFISGTGSIGIGNNTSPLATLDIRTNSDTQAVASVSAKSNSFAGMVVDNRGTGAIFAASSSGLNRFLIANNGNVGIGTVTPRSLLDLGTDGAALTIGGLSSGAQINFGSATGENAITFSNNQLGLYTRQSNGFRFYTNTDSDTATPEFIIADDGTITLNSNYTSCGALTTNGSNVLTCGSASSGSSQWNIASGLLYNGNLTTDVAIGGNSSTSAKFKVSPVGTQVTASVSGLTSSAATVIDQAGSGDIFTASKSGKTLFTIRNNGVLKIGDNSNGLEFDYVNPGSSGMQYLGSARPSKQIVLSPEYSGGIITASGSSTTDGDLTADASTSANLSLGGTTNNFLTYYEWSSAETTQQDTTIAVRLTLPADFSSWRPGGSSMQILFNTELTTATSQDDNKLEVRLIPEGQSGGAVGPAVYTQNIKGTANKTWTTLNIPASDLIDSTQAWNTASRSAMLYLKMSSRNNNYVQIGDIILNYLSSF